MGDQGFNGSQLKQLKDLLVENNKQLFTVIGSVEENLGKTIQDVEQRLNEKIETEVYSVRTELRDSIKNLALTMPTKYEVKQLQDKVGISS